MATEKHKQLRILQVCSADSIGGGERHVVDLSRALMERGHELHLAVRKSSPLRSLLLNTDAHFHELPLRNATDISSSRRLAMLVREHRLDLIHGHVARDYPVCGLAARMSGANLFLTRHHFRPFPRSRVYQWAISPVRRLIAVSASVAANLAQSFPGLVSRIVVIPNWIQAGNIATASRDEAREVFGLKGSMAVGVIGQISPIKGQEIVIRAAACLKATGIDSVEVVLAGEAASSDHAYKDHLVSLARELGVEDRVRFVGYVPEVSRYLRAFDLVVAPSRDEGFSLVVMEAMAAGLPVIASSVGGPAEIIEHDETGLLITPNDLDTLVESMGRLLSNQQLRGQLGRAASASVRLRFDRARVVDQIERLYLDHLSSR